MRYNSYLYKNKKEIKKMALFGFGKKMEEEENKGCCCGATPVEEVKSEPACACNGDVQTYEAESSCCCGGNQETNTCCGEEVNGICCIKVLGAGCKSCHPIEYLVVWRGKGLSLKSAYPLANLKPL